MIKRICENCGSIFYTYPSRLNGSSGHKAKYCSKKCSNIVSFKKWNKAGSKTRFKPGQVSFSKKHPELMPSGIEHHKWKGDEVGYRGLHYWIRRQKGKPDICEMCSKKAADWANTNGKYNRNLNDYIPLCKSCHKKYDISHKLTHRLF